MIRQVTKNCRCGNTHLIIINVGGKASCYNATASMLNHGAATNGFYWFNCSCGSTLVVE
jgi:hypothetical protein